MVAPGTHPDRTEMRFTRFPRGEHQPSPPSARRVAAAKRAVQAEKDRYPLFPELVRYATTQKAAWLPELRRLKLISQGRLPNPWKRS